MYADFQMLFRTTIARDPACWMAHNNLGIALAERGQWDEASGHFRKCLDIKPDHAEAHNNLSMALQRLGKLDDAIEHAEQALALNPNYAECHFNLGNALSQKGQADEAIAHYRKALEISPEYVKAHINLGIALLGRGQLDDAAAQFRACWRSNPPNRREPEPGRRPVRTGPDPRALQRWRDVLRRQPDQVAVLSRCGWILATDPDASVRNASEAVTLAERAFHQSQGRDPAVSDTLAAAYAEAGRFPEAVQVAQLALEQAAAVGNTALMDAVKKRVELYRAGSPYREPRRKAVKVRRITP